LSLCSSVLSFGQTAKVVALSPERAATAKELYEAKEAANKAWDEFYKDVWTNEGKDVRTNEGENFGYGYGIEFSTDFKFLVPKTTPTSGEVIIGNTLGHYDPYDPYHHYDPHVVYCWTSGIATSSISALPCPTSQSQYHFDAGPTYVQPSSPSFDNQTKN
jgi:hypothetical protein